MTFAQSPSLPRLLPAFIRLVPALALLLFAIPTFAAQDAPAVSEFKLANGLDVVVIPDHRAPVVTNMIWYKAGSADEAPGKSGIAHFFEHLMFKSTKNHPAGEFTAAVAAIGGQQNAFTSDDYTAFFEKVPPSALEEMMRYEADRMRNLILTDAVIIPERKVIMEERRMRVDNNPQALLGEELDATLFENQPYRFPVIGWMHEIAKLNRVDAMAFYNRYYAPNNAVVVVAGDVTPEQVRQYAEATYGKLPRGEDLPPRVRPTEPVHHARKTVTLSDPRVTLPSFQKLWIVPSYHTAKNGEAEALDLLAEILGDGTRSRLYQAFIVKKEMASSVGAFYQGTMLDDTKFGVYAATIGPTGLQDLEKGVDAEIERIKKDGVTADELEKAKKRFVRSMIFARDNQEGMARLYGSTLATGGTVKDIEEWSSKINAVTADQVKAVAVKYLDPKIAVTGYLLPAGEGDKQ